MKKLLMLCCMLFLLVNCTPQTENTIVVQPIKKQNNPYPLPSHAYIALAEKQEGQEKQATLLMAAGRSLQEGHLNQASTILALTRELSDEQIKEKVILQAKLAIQQDKSQAAIIQLASVKDISSLSQPYQALYHEVLANAYSMSGNAVYAVKERVKLDALFQDHARKVQNNRAIWEGLTQIPTPELEAMLVETKEDTAFNGWLKLAEIPRLTNQDPSQMTMRLQEWMELYPQHPGQNLLPESLITVSKNSTYKPQRVALLLPLSGPLSGPGHALLDGFMDQKRMLQSNLEVKIYDVNTKPVGELYTQAINEGAGVVLGPLSKADVGVVAALPHPVPTILLNETSKEAEPNSFQFALSPAKEAKLIARKAIQKGMPGALVISPSGPWGEEIRDAFARTYKAKGGKIVAEMSYDSHSDLNKKVKELLQVDASQTRIKQLRQLLGHSLETAESRRQDFSMIFLVAYPSKARQIMPLLKYYYANKIPVFAPSIVYSGNPDRQKDKDLDGLYFCDLPWMFIHAKPAKPWPEQLNSYNRLYAMGRNSYLIATQLNELLLFPGMQSTENTGFMYLTPTKTIKPREVWGKFDQGLVQKVPSSAFL